MNVAREFAVAVAIAMTFGGCASPGELRSKAPAAQEKSTRSAKTVAGCIADKWESVGNRVPIAARPTSNGYALTAASDLGMYGKDTSFVIDVDDVPNGSTTRFYSNIALSSGTELVAGIVRGCQN